MTTRRALRTLIVSNSRTPNNDALFRELAAQPAVDLLVAYCCDREAFRQWNLGPVDGYDHLTMPGWTFGVSTHVNPGAMRVIRDFGPDVAILTGSYTMPTFLMAAAALRSRGTPWAYWGEPLQGNPCSVVRAHARTLLRQPLRLAHGVLAIGRRAVESYAALGIPRQRIANFHYYADVEHFRMTGEHRAGHRRRMREQLGLGDETLVFLFCGQLIHRKGVDTLLDAAARLRARGAEFAVVVAGDGPDRALLEAQAGQLGIGDRVRFVGFTEPRELPSHFAAADVFVLPSRQEGWGMVVPEAMAAEMPVIASDAVNAAAELLEHGRSGFLFPAGDADALASAMHEFVLTRPLLGEMAARAHCTAMAESPRRAAPRLARILAALRETREINTL